MTDEDGKKVFVSVDGSLVRLILQEAVSVTGCDTLVQATNYPDFFVVPLESPPRFIRTISAHAVSLVSYINNRDDFLFSHLNARLEEEFHHVLGADCRMRIQQQQLQFWLQHRDPGLTTWILGNGTFATAAGEVLYHYQCAPVQVRAVNRDQRCYQALPVEVMDSGDSTYLGGRPMFLEPLTHRLTTEGIVVPCSKQFVAKFRNLNGDWIQAAPELFRATTPFMLGAEALEKRLSGPQIDPAHGGLYTEEDLRSMEAYRDLPRAITRISADFVSQAPYQVNLRDPEALWSLFPGAPRFDIWAMTVSFIHDWGQVAAFFFGAYSLVNLSATVIIWLFRGVQMKRVEGCNRKLCWVPCLDLYLMRRWTIPAYGQSYHLDPVQPPPPEAHA